MKKIAKIFQWVKARYDNVWVDKYPTYWHLIDLLGGLVCGITMAITYDATIGVKVGLFFSITILGYLMMLAFTYGIVRARHGWTKKRK